jgi:hypothetical protein
VAFLMGFWYGLFAWCVFKLMLAIYPASKNEVALAIAILLGISGVSVVGQIGMTTNDVATASIMMCAILACTIGLREKTRLYFTAKYLAVGGFFCGLAVGSKLSVAVFGLALFLSTLISLLTGSKTNFTYSLCAFIFAAILGCAITGGFWHYFLWREYQNPFFPYFNDYFQSPFAETRKLIDYRFRAITVSKLLSLPFFIAKKNTLLVAEGTFADPRLLIGYISIILITVVSFYRKIKKNVVRVPSFLPTHMIVFFIALWVLGYGFWAYLHGIHRYAVILEPLSVVLLLILIDLFKPSRKVFLIAIAVIFITTFSQTKYMGWGRLYGYGINTLDVQPPPIENNSLVVMLSDGEALSYLIPFFNPMVKFAYPKNNLMDPKNNNLMQLKANDVINNWSGPMYALAPGRYNFYNDVVLSAFRLKIDYLGKHGGCRPVSTNIELPFPQICALTRE